MPILPITLENLGQLDNGIAGKAIDRALSVAVSDLEDRGADGKPRKVTIEIEMSKLSNGDSLTTLKAWPSLPKMQTMGTRCAFRADEKGEMVLVFSAQAPDNPDQETLYSGDEDK